MSANNSGSDSRLKGFKILLVEDSEDNQFLIRHYLEAVGAHVTVANHGLEAMDQYRTQSFDIVVMDIQMPKMDGHQTTKALRTEGFMGPVIALTAHAIKEEREKAFAHGVNDYLTKPIDRNLLIARIVILLNS